ncbi:hypothetical protein [Actinoplanes sp. L3-i22]|uniref:hypothetical protein n=1 Tax=Actinoplanes sp. L3-i22 TaxID=2836373 RepID=UPI001C79097E|nr:hypothetical protein [Actinoplanes sp. L3-i22]BCY11080.1 hypothetical protein L3i22_061680 [Actinoplanes sp. L3-i22]
MASQRRPGTRQRGRQHTPLLGRLDSLPAALAAARQLQQNGQTASAVNLLAAHLHERTHNMMADAPMLADACILYATLTTGDDQLRAAAYAYRASRNLHPGLPTHPRRLEAAATYGSVLQQHGRHDEAITVRRGLLAAYRDLDRTADILTATTDLAASLHTAGHCAEASRAIACAWHIWSDHTPHTDLDTGTAVLAAHMRILRSCRRHLDLIALLHRTRDTRTWNDLAAARTAATDTADTAYIDRHSSSCTYSPQQATGTPPAVPAPHASPQPAAPPPAALRPPFVHVVAVRRVRQSRARVRHPLASYQPSDIAGAFSIVVTAPEAQPLLDPGHIPEAEPTAAQHQLTARVASYLAHQRARRATLRTAAAVLPIAVVLLTLLLL